MRPLFWRDRMAAVQPYWWDEAAELFREAEPLRARAKFNTGSISMMAAVALRAVSTWVAAPIAIEVGTFIGVSTRSIRSDRIYTCDASNDCLDADTRITCYPYRTSTQMLKHLRGLKPRVLAGFFFFDGLLSEEDCDLVVALSSPEAVYVFDDYNESFKGVQNVSKLHPRLTDYDLFPASSPLMADTTLAALVPRSRL